jgi:hypothetical protein
MPEDRPPEPQPYSWNPPGICGGLEPSGDTHEMKVCQEALSEIDAAHVRKHRNRAGGIEAHSLYTRLKVAAALAILAECDSVAAEFWELSRYIMKVSDRTRADIAGHLDRLRGEENLRAGKARGEQSVAAQEVVVSASARRVAGNILKHLNGEWISGGLLRNKRIRSEDRMYFEDAIAILLKEREIERRQHEYQNQSGFQYRIRDVRRGTYVRP